MDQGVLMCKLKEKHVLGPDRGSYPLGISLSSITLKELFLKDKNLYPLPVHLILTDEGERHTQ